MKKDIFVIVLFFCSTIISYSQTDLQKIQAPSSPAGFVIGIQPSTVLSPKSYEAFEAAIFSNYYNGQGQALIPDNLGIEFSPYWAKDRPVTMENYLFPTPVQSLWRNLSVSIASTKNYILRDTIKSAAIGIGLRTSLYFNDMKEQIMKEVDSLKYSNKLKGYLALSIDKAIIKNPTIKNLEQGIDTLIAKLGHDATFLSLFDGKKENMALFLESFSVQCKRNLPPFDPAKPKEFRSSFNDFLDIVLNLTFKLYQVEYLVNNRPGFKIDIAAALALDFPTNNFDFSIAPQQSIWVTPTYRFAGKSSFLEILAVVRYNWYNLSFYKQYFPGNETYEHNFDYGISANLLFKKFSLHAEAVGRYSKSIIGETLDPVTGITTTLSKTQTDFQYMGTFSYQINKKLIVSYSLGNQFKPILSYNGTLISSFGLNFGFGGPTSDNLVK